MTSQLITSSNRVDADLTSAGLSYAAGSTDVALLEETIGDNLRRIARINAHAEAIVDVPSGRRWTYAQFQRDVDALARGLLRIGLEAGDRVGIWAGNCPEWTILQYATANIGVILVTINPAYRRHELGYVLNQSGVRLLVAARTVKGADLAAMIDGVRPHCPASKRSC